MELPSTSHMAGVQHPSYFDVFPSKRSTLKKGMSQLPSGKLT